MAHVAGPRRSLGRAVSPDQREAIIKAASDYGDASYDIGTGTVDGSGFASVEAWKAFLAAVDAVNA